MPVTGIVTNQVVTISPTTLQRILLILSAAPEPTIAELITCGVLTGIPKIDAIEISTIEVICESSAFIGFIRYIRPPRFRICRQSPIEPPNAKATAHEINTQLGTAKKVIRPAKTKPNAIAPIDFCASFELFANASKIIVATWERWKKTFILGVAK